MLVYFLLFDHEVHELVEVDGSAPVLVHLLEDADQLGLGQLGVQLPENLLEGVGRDEAVTLLVVYAERFLQLLSETFFILLTEEPVELLKFINHSGLSV